MYQTFVGKLKRGKEQEYIEAHRNVWPELKRSMRDAGVLQEMVFMLDNYLFVYIEADDVDATKSKLAADPVNQRWDVFMAPLLEPPVAGSTELFPQLVEVFK